MDPQEFLRTLWGDPPPGVINVFRLPDRASSWHRMISGINETLSRYEHEEVYTGVSLADQQKGRFTTRNRIAEAEAGAIAGVWADIDVFHPVHTKAERLPGTREEAQEVMKQLPYEPTLIIDSGHGLQYWWLLKTPWVFGDEAEWGEARRMVQYWHHQTKDLFDARGWTTDSVYDLSRILRIPGTFNNKVKEDRKEVTAVKTGGPRYDREDFLRLVPEEFVATAPAPEQRRGRRGRAAYEASATASGLILDPDAEPPHLQMEILLKAHPKFRASWEMKRSDLDDSSPSGYDLSLASFGVIAEWPDQRIVDLLIAFRRRHALPAKLRLRYYERTLATAKASVNRVRVVSEQKEKMTEGDDDGASDEGANPEDDQVQNALQSLNVVFPRLKIRGITVFRSTTNTSAVLETQRGTIHLQTTQDILDMNRFVTRVMEGTTIVLVLTFKKSEWLAIAQLIMNAGVPADMEFLSTLTRECDEWIGTYLINNTWAGTPEDAAAEQLPCMYESHIHVHFWHCKAWLRQELNIRLEDHQFAERLTLSGWEPYRKNIGSGPQRTTWRSWRRVKTGST